VSKGNGTALPTGAGRVIALVQRSAPDPTRPRLADEWETQLAEVEARSAGCYASMEDLSDRLDQFIQDLSDGVVVEEINEEEDDSLVFHIGAAQFVLPVTGLKAAGNGSIKR
jgi:hypothetical protein